jgi:hypothetical protein
MFHKSKQDIKLYRWCSSSCGDWILPPSDYVRLRLYFPFQVYYSFFVLCFLSGFQSLSILHQQDSNTLHLSTIITTLLAFVAWKCHHMTWTLIPYQLLFLRSAIDSENVFFEIWWNLAYFWDLLLILRMFSLRYDGISLPCWLSHSSQDITPVLFCCLLSYFWNQNLYFCPTHL